MASPSRRVVGWLPIAFLLAAGPLAWLSPPASAEARKFVVILADLYKDHPGTSLSGLLPKRADAWDAYFDTTKNSRTGGPRVDSFAEWWAQCSYGDVTVSGDVYGWIAPPWASRPPGFTGGTGGHATGTLKWIELQGGDMYSPGSGESFSTFRAKFDFDFDGPGQGSDPVHMNGAGQSDSAGFRVFTPGERFLDLNSNGVYDAGIPELWIDKNGDGQLGPQATSWAQLIASRFTLSDPNDPNSPLVWAAFTNNTEWFDSSGDGQPGLFGTEIWVDKNGDGLLGEKAAPDEGSDRASLIGFITQLYDPDGNVEWWDLGWAGSPPNGVFDFPEPYEDYMRRWGTTAHDFTHDFIPVTDQYIADNYPGDITILQTWNPDTNPQGRTGNHQYDSPDSWSNYNDLYSTNKMQEVLGLLHDPDENAERFARSFRFTPEPDWLSDVWAEYYHTAPPPWDGTIPYLRRFRPDEPVPWLISQPEPAKPSFEPNRGGPYNTGAQYSDKTWGAATGTIVQPNWADPDIGMYDGPAEYDDIPSSIYHMGGDEGFGEITGPENDSYWGKDTGPGNPDAASFPDGIIPAAGPLAFNVHGDGGWDAGNQLTTEYHTWRTNGQGLTDITIDFDGDGRPDYVLRHRDVNLDGMIDVGEAPGVQNEIGLPNRTPQHNYGVDGDPGTPPNGGPSSLYPYNRLRLMEDCVEALDHTVDWDNFLNGPPPWGERISGVIFVPPGTGLGMFGLPAASYFTIRTRDRVDPGASGREYYVPITFWNGLGTSLSAGQGEGGQWDNTGFALGFAIHEYCHTWEGYPDLYDYDVWREDFAGRIINNPIGGWDIMAGGLVHPAGILKMSSGWIDAVDITRLLFPLSNTTVTFRPWEFSRDRTLFQYDNPLYDGELFHLWRNSHDIDSWDKNQPGRGIIIQHLDLHANPEGLPIQQRLESHFIYMMVQADGLQDMEAGRNGGDAGDSWPGSANAAVWNKNTDPSNRWYDEQPSGLEITSILETDDTSSDVTFFWSPRELPTYIWVQPPREDVSHNGIFTLMFVAYDQFGGAEMWFYAVPSSPDDPTPGYDNGIALNNMAYTKQPGEINGAFGANVRDLPDGTYTFYVQLVPGVGADGRLENTHSRPRAGIDNIGNGRVVHEVAGKIVDGVDVDISISRLEVWTLTVIDDRSPGAETWQVVGQYSGTQTTQAITGLLYNSDPDTLGRSAVSFTIQAGNIPFRNGDRFSFMTTGLTPHSSAVLIDNGEVVKPEPPVAVASVDRGIQSGLAPLDVVFKHDGSSDPHDAALTFTWDFGDGSLPFTTTQLDRPAPHRYGTPGLYTARLTVTNAFNLSSQATVPIHVLRADAPTVRIDATPLIGPAPLQVAFSGERTTDSNPARQGLDYVWDFGDRSAPVFDVRTTHTFAKPGTYVVTLTVTNRPYGESGFATVEIRATGTAADLPPNAVLDANKLFGKSPLTVQFDARQSSDPEGRTLSYGWSFGDGAVLVDAPAVVEHTFQRVGNFPVTLTVTDVTDQSDTATLVVSVTANAASGSQAPVARIRASTLQGPAPLAVTLDARDSSDPEGGPLSFAWSFGDDSNAQEGEVVTHTYTVAGQYTVRLVALDSSGATGETTVKIVVTSPAGETPSTQPSDTGQTIPEIPTACSPGCGPVGLMPVLLTLLGIAGLRRCRNRWMG